MYLAVLMADCQAICMYLCYFISMLLVHTTILSTLVAKQLYTSGLQLNQHILCTFVVSQSTACPYFTVLFAASGYL